MDVTVLSAADAETALTEEDCAVVVDALRASATAIALLEVGAESVVPVAGDGADRFDSEWIKVGEHHGERIAGFDLGNSPTAVRERAALFEGEDVVLRTTNGTRCVERVESAGTVMMGSLLDAETLVETCRDRLPADARVAFVPAGRRGERAPEDTYTAIALARRLQAVLGDSITISAPEDLLADTNGNGNGDVSTNASADTSAQTAASAAPTATVSNTEAAGEYGGESELRSESGADHEVGDLRPAEDVFVESDTGRFLASKGWEEDVRFCAQEDVFSAVPVLEDGRFVDGRPDEAPDGGRTEREPDASHLEDIDPSCGCVGVWEHLSEQRSRDDER